MNTCCETCQTDEGHCFAGSRCKQLGAHVSETPLQHALYQCFIARHSLNLCRAVQNTQIGLVTSLIFLAYLYFAFYFFNIRRANRMLANESYAKYKQAPFYHLPIYHLPFMHRASVVVVPNFNNLIVEGYCACI